MPAVPIRRPAPPRTATLAAALVGLACVMFVPASRAQTVVLQELPRGQEFITLFEAQARRAFPDARVTFLPNGRFDVRTAQGQALTGELFRDRNDAGMQTDVTEIARRAGCRDVRTLMDRRAGEVRAVSWSAMCGPGPMFLGAFFDTQRVQGISFLAPGAPRELVERAQVLMQQPALAFRELPAADPLPTMEERVAYMMFRGVRAGEQREDCEATTRENEPRARRVTLTQRCGPPDARDDEEVVVERLSACRYRFAREQRAAFMAERMEGEFDFAAVDWSQVSASPGAVRAEGLVPTTQTYMRRGPATAPLLESRTPGQFASPIAVEQGEDPEAMLAQWRAVVGAFRRECPGRK